MQAEQTETELIIRESPGCLWMFGLFFAFVGGVFVYGSLGGLADYDRQAPWMLALAFLMGAIGIAAGIRIIYRAPITQIVINRVENEVLMTRYGLFGRQKTLYNFDEIEQFCLIEERDSEGDEIWSLGMKLINDETVKITSLPSHDERFKSNFVFQANEFMRKQLPSTEMILEAADEDREEMR